MQADLAVKYRPRGTIIGKYTKQIIMQDARKVPGRQSIKWTSNSSQSREKYWHGKYHGTAVFQKKLVPARRSFVWPRPQEWNCKVKPSRQWSSRYVSKASSACVSISKLTWVTTVVYKRDKIKESNSKPYIHVFVQTVQHVDIGLHSHGVLGT